MKASEARSQADAIVRKEAAEKSAALKKRRAALKESVPRLRAQRIDQIEKDIRQRIKYAVESGYRETTITLSSEGHDLLRQRGYDYKYLPTRITGYDHSYYQKREIRSYMHAVGKGYLKYAPWGKYLKTALARIARDGYKWEIDDVSTTHDDSAAYLNSGGECGSETPYYTRDTELTISW